MTLLDHRNDFPETEFADVWGYTQKDGTEYGIIGTNQGTALYLLLADGRMRLIQHIPGDQSLWRDIKSFGDYIYVIADQGDDGLLVIDMKKAPNVINWHYWRPFISVNNTQGDLTHSHNLWIDENGVLFLAGCNVNKGGVVMLDLTADAWKPPFLGAADPRYSHDCFARNHTLWSADIIDGFFSVTDVSDKTAPLLLATQRTGARFTHNVWLSDDNKYLFTTDEVGNAAVEAYDVENLNNIAKLDEYRPAATLNRNVIPHNVHYYQGYLVISYYTDGVKIVDAHRPENLVEVGSYDTWPGPDGNYHGCWGAFPFLPSGRILASDIESGLFFFEPDYQRAAYLEGTVTNALTGAQLVDVKVQIVSEQPNLAFSDLNGQYKTGQAAAGSFSVTFSKEGFETIRVAANLKNGELTLLDVQMTPLASFHIQGIVKDAQTGQPVPNADIILRNSLSYFPGKADDQGRFTLNGVFQEQYEVLAVGWGYRYLQVPSLRVDGSGPYELTMTPGYQDDFWFDLGWRTGHEPNVNNGLWVRDIPRGTSLSGLPANPGRDIPNDFGEFCYLTGNGGGSANRDDVDKGTVTLTSPPMDLRIYQDPVVTYYLWFFNSPNGNDQLSVYLSDGVEKILVEQLTTGSSEWRERSEIRVRDFLLPGENITLIVETADQPDQDHVVEAGIDGFQVFDFDELTAIKPAYQNFPGLVQLYPNPGSGPVFLDFELNTPVKTLTVEIIGLTGQIIARREISPSRSGRMELTDLPEQGLFIVRLLVNGRYAAVRKLVRM